MGPKYMPAYTDLAMVPYDEIVVEHSKEIGLQLVKYSRFRDDMNLKVRGEVQDVETKLGKLIKKMHSKSSRIKFELEGKAGARTNNFLDIREVIRDDHIAVDVYSKPTNTHSYLLYNSVHPQRTWKAILTGVAHRLRMICDDEFLPTQMRRTSMYFLNRGYPIKLIDKVFLPYLRRSKDDILDGKHKLKNSSYFNRWTKEHWLRRCRDRDGEKGSDYDERDRNTDKETAKRIWLTHKYHPSAENLLNVVRRHYGILAGNADLNELLPLESFYMGFRIHENLRRMLHPAKKSKRKQKEHRFERADVGTHKCGRAKCKCCALVETNKFFKSTHYGQRHKVRARYDCSSKGVIYVAECKVCGKQYGGSTMHVSESAVALFAQNFG